MTQAPPSGNEPDTIEKAHKHTQGVNQKMAHETQPSTTITTPSTSRWDDAYSLLAGIFIAMLIVGAFTVFAFTAVGDSNKAWAASVAEVGYHLDAWYESAEPGDEIVVKMGADTFEIGDKITVERPEYLHTKTTTFTADEPYSWCFEARFTSSGSASHYLPGSGVESPGYCPYSPESDRAALLP